ncbi:MAG: fumarylacetoacetase [Phycisphaerales bacterium]|nr:MAG: fumarylacetoacetase [Phycisphaerales bacterium]
MADPSHSSHPRWPIDQSHDPQLESWVESANDPSGDFPIQNLPLCLFERPDAGPAGGSRPLTVGVRIGDALVDLCLAAERGLLHDASGGRLPSNLPARRWLSEAYAPNRAALRAQLQGLLVKDAPGRDRLEPCMVPVASLDPQALGGWDELVGDYTDFYASLFHATNVGSMFRPDNPLLPNYKHVPIGYHGRASSLVPSGTGVRRPVGQKAPPAEGQPPGFGPSSMLDYELEVGLVVAKGNPLGEPIAIEHAEDAMLGLCLVNDWSARDIQKWEYQPLGPFLAKSFATTVSPWIVTMEALAPFRARAFTRPAGDPAPLPYLTSQADAQAGGFALTLEVLLSTAQMRQRGVEPIRISQGSFQDMYWTFAQMLAHHSSNGCNMRPGDLLASGTVSGPSRDSRGCLLERTWNGDAFADPPCLVPGSDRTPIELPTGEQRTFLEDGDEVIIRGWCQRDGYRRIGLGECRGTILPARTP